MRSTSLLRTLLALQRTRFLDLEFEGDALVVHVVPTWKVSRCSQCGKKCKSGYDDRRQDWRHMDLAGIKTILRYRMRRVDCKRCGVFVEKVPWAESASRYTFPMEGLVAYHAQKTDHTTVATLMLLGGPVPPLRRQPTRPVRLQEPRHLPLVHGPAHGRDCGAPGRAPLA